MDILENNVRSECKQAFAELQTDLTDLTMELETTGIPIVPHRAYVMNVFFPGVFWRIFQNWLCYLRLLTKINFRFRFRVMRRLVLWSTQRFHDFSSNLFFHYIFQVWVNIPSFYNKFPNGKTARIACLAFPWPNLSNLSWTKRFCWPWSTPWNSNRDSASVIG